MDEARRQWEMPRRLLVSWKDRGLGGDDVQALIQEGDSIVHAPAVARAATSARTSTNSR